MLTPLQKATAEAIVNMFETGRVLGDYGNITLIKGDSGGLTYGRSQTTIASGNLYKLALAYCNAPGAVYAAALRPYLPRLQARDRSLDTDMTLRKLLADAGDKDPVMKATQDSFFDAVYWQPAQAAAERIGIQTALGMAVVYDSYIHGSFAKIAARTDNAVGTVRTASEKVWITEYVKQRKAWLTSCGKPLSNTTYRQRTFERLIAAGKWDLQLPLVAWTETITEAILGVKPAEPSGWTLYLNDDKLGEAWTNPDDQDRAYFPARDLLQKLHGVAETGASLQYENGTLEWDGKTMNVPAVLRADGKVWGQVRALAKASGLTVDVDDTARAVRLTRGKAVANAS